MDSWKKNCGTFQICLAMISIFISLSFMIDFILNGLILYGTFIFCCGVLISGLGLYFGIKNYLESQDDKINY